MALSLSLPAQTVRCGVFSLFHPRQITFRPGSSEPLLIQEGGSSRILEGNRSETAEFPQAVRITSRSGGAADVVLSVPGKIDRRYRGTISISPNERELVVIVVLDLEVAVASVVAAEIAPGAPFEALKAQAVAARSFLLASPARHKRFQFCDTTHCQFLREWPPIGTEARRATVETTGLALTYQRQVIAARYSAACGGHTITSNADLPGSHGYRYRAVPCGYCLRHANEPVRGHRLGLCQQGACGMAEAGSSFREILSHYYPGTLVVERSSH